MDDLAQKLNDLLSSPDSMEKIQSAMAAMGLDGDGGGDDGGASRTKAWPDTHPVPAGRPYRGGGKEKPAHADQRRPARPVRHRQNGAPDGRP